MTETLNTHDRVADAAFSELSAARPSDDSVGAATTAAALLAQRAAQEVQDRDRVIRIAKREGATLRALAEATGLSRQTIDREVPLRERQAASGSAPAEPLGPLHLHNFAPE